MKINKIKIISVILIILTTCSVVSCYGNSYQAEKENLEKTITENNEKIDKINNIQESLHQTAELIRDYNIDRHILTGLSQEWLALNEEKQYLISDNEKFTARLSEIQKEEARKEYKGVFKLYAYSGDGITSTGVKPKVNHTIAVDPKIIPYGSQVYIEGYGTYYAEDCGGAIKGNVIDIFMSSDSECNKFGVRNAKVYIIK